MLVCLHEDNGGGLRFTVIFETLDEINDLREYRDNTDRKMSLEHAMVCIITTSIYGRSVGLKLE